MTTYSIQSEYGIIIIYQLTTSTTSAIYYSTYNSVDIHIYLANKRHAPISCLRTESIEKNGRRRRVQGKKNENAIKIIRRFSPFLLHRRGQGRWWWWRRRLLLQLSQPFSLCHRTLTSIILCILNFHINDCIICRLTHTQTETRVQLATNGNRFGRTSKQIELCVCSRLDSTTQFDYV